MCDYELDPCNSKFYGEWVFFEDENEKLMAEEYLKLWKFFILKKLKNMKQIGQDQYVLRENILPESLLGNIPGQPIKTLGLKIQVEKNI